MSVGCLGESSLALKASLHGCLEAHKLAGVPCLPACRHDKGCLRNPAVASRAEEAPGLALTMAGLL